MLNSALYTRFDNISRHGLIVHKKGKDLSLLINIIAYLVLLTNLYIALDLKPPGDKYKFQIYYLIAQLVLFGGAFFLHVQYKNIFNKNIFILVVLLDASLFCSYAFNGFRHGGIALFMVFFGYFYLFCILPKYKLPKLFDKTIISFCLYISLLPVFKYLVLNQQSMIANDGTFMGFSYSRSGYGYMAGATILVLIIRNTRLKYIAIPFVAYGLILSQSRSSIIAILMASSYLLINRQKKINKLFLYLISIILIVIVYQVLAQRTTRDREKIDLVRIKIYSEFIEFIKSHPVWGYGGDYKIEIYSDSGKEFIIFAPAHNIILQTWASFGLIVLILFFTLFFYNMRRFNIFGRAFYLYILILGMFQPAFEVGISSLFYTLNIFAICYHQYGSANRSKYENRPAFLSSKASLIGLG